MDHKGHGIITEPVLSATVRNGKITCDLCTTSVPADAWKRMDQHMEIHAANPPKLSEPADRFADHE